jgi:DNA-directed RNA polymerase
MLSEKSAFLPCSFQVGSRLIQLLMETAYIQPPVNQLADGPPDIRPAFVHSLRNVMKEGK